VYAPEKNHEGGTAAPAHPGGQPVAQGHYFAFRFALGHGFYLLDFVSDYNLHLID
jgi:hypothetical protein